MALGWDLPGVFTDDEELAAEIARHSELARDPTWRLPLWKPYAKKLASKVADTNNISTGGLAGAITAALFLQKFTPKTAKKGYCHIDMNGYVRGKQETEQTSASCARAPMRAADAMLTLISAQVECWAAHPRCHGRGWRSTECARVPLADARALWHRQLVLRVRAKGGGGEPVGIHTRNYTQCGMIARLSARSPRSLAQLPCMRGSRAAHVILKVVLVAAYQLQHQLLVIPLAVLAAALVTVPAVDDVAIVAQ